MLTFLARTIGLRSLALLLRRGTPMKLNIRSLTFGHRGVPYWRERAESERENVRAPDTNGWLVV